MRFPLFLLSRELNSHTHVFLGFKDSPKQFLFFDATKAIKSIHLVHFYAWWGLTCFVCDQLPDSSNPRNTLFPSQAHSIRSREISYI